MDFDNRTNGSSSLLELLGGIDIHGKLVFPDAGYSSNHTLSISTTMMIVQGELSMSSITKPINGRPHIHITMIGHDVNQTFTPIDNNARACAIGTNSTVTASCKVGKKSIVVAGGKVNRTLICESLSFFKIHNAFTFLIIYFLFVIFFFFFRLRGIQYEVYRPTQKHGHDCLMRLDRVIITRTLFIWKIPTSKGNGRSVRKL